MEAGLLLWQPIGQAGNYRRWRHAHCWPWRRGCIQFHPQSNKLYGAERNSLVIACVNSPCNVTVSGKASNIDTLKATLDAENIMNRKLRIQNAYHSPSMEAITDEYRDSIRGLQQAKVIANATFYSFVTGTIARATDLLNPGPEFDLPNAFQRGSCKHVLWRRVRSQKSGGSTMTDLLEVGPHSDLR